MHAGNFETELKWGKRAGAFATLLTMIVTARFGWMQGEDIYTRFAYAGGLALCSFFVGYSLVFAHKANSWGLKGIQKACVGVFIVCVGIELLSHMGSAASARLNDIEKASVQTNTYGDTRANLQAARAELASLPKARPSGAVEAELDKMKSRKGWAESNACADVGSYPTLCRQVNGLRAELATAKQRDSLNARIETLSNTSATTTVGHSVVDSQTSFFASLASGTTKPTDEAKFWTNAFVTALVALYFVCMGLVNMIIYALEDHLRAKREPAPQPLQEVRHSAQIFQVPAAPTGAPAFDRVAIQGGAGRTGLPVFHAA